MKHFAFNIFLFTQMVIALVCYYTFPDTYDEHLLLGIIICSILDIICFLRYKARTKISFKYGLISLLFVGGYFIVFFQKYLDLILGFISPYNTLFASILTITKCALISYCGLLAFLIGYINMHIKVSTKNRTVFSIVPLGPFKFLFVLSTLLYVFYNYRYALSQSYSQEILEAQAGTMILYSNIVFQVVVFAYFAYFSVNRRGKGLGWISYAKEIGGTIHVCLLVYIFMVLLTGDRGPVIMITLVYFGGYLFYLQKDYSWVRLLIVILVSLVFFSTLGEARKLDKNISFAERMIQGRDSLNEHQTILPQTAELAGSVSTLHYSVLYVPDKYPYLLGSFQIRQIFSAIPFFNHVVYQFTDSHFRYTSSSFYITWLIQGEYYTYGSGSSCNADLYLSWGLWGVIIGLFLWGYIIQYIEFKWASKAVSPVMAIIIQYFLGYSIYVCRDSLLVFLNFMVFTILFDFIYRRLLLKNLIK